MAVAQLSLFVHILAAIALLGGILGVHVLGHLARRAPTLDQRRHLVVEVSPAFEQLIPVAGGMTILTGLVTLVMFGYSITDLWVLATGLLLICTIAITSRYWPRTRARVREALDRGEDAAASRFIRDPRTVGIGRLEGALEIGIVALMVFRPNWPG